MGGRGGGGQKSPGARRREERRAKSSTNTLITSSSIGLFLGRPTFRFCGRLRYALGGGLGPSSITYKIKLGQMSKFIGHTSIQQIIHVKQKGS